MRVELKNILSRILQYKLICLAVVLALFGQSPIHAGTPTNWVTWVGAYNGGAEIGVRPASHDGWDGQAPDWYFSETGVYLLLYREHSTEWGGQTGFYPADYESPIPPGGSKTWWDFYLWSHDYTPDPPNQIQVRNVYEFAVDQGPPNGYIGHLVIDQVAAGVTWIGPMDYWFDMTQFNTFTLPIATVTDPLQGTRFHLTVYAPPVPEPASLTALCVGLVPLIMRRRRQ